MNENITIKHSIYGEQRTNLLTGTEKVRPQKPQERGEPHARPWTAEDDKALREGVWRGDQGWQLRRLLPGRTLQEIRERAKQLRLPPIPTQPSRAKLLLERRRTQ
jgi:hypothetical protein